MPNSRRAIPYVDDLIDAINPAEYSMTIDANNGEVSIPTCCTCTDPGLYEGVYGDEIDSDDPAFGTGIPLGNGNEFLLGPGKEVLLDFNAYTFPTFQYGVSGLTTQECTVMRHKGDPEMDVFTVADALSSDSWSTTRFRAVGNDHTDRYQTQSSPDKWNQAYAAQTVRYKCYFKNNYTQIGLRWALRSSDAADYFESSELTFNLNASAAAANMDAWVDTQNNIRISWGDSFDGNFNPKQGELVNDTPIDHQYQPTTRNIFGALQLNYELENQSSFPWLYYDDYKGLITFTCPDTAVNQEEISNLQTGTYNSGAVEVSLPNYTADSGDSGPFYRTWTTQSLYDFDDKLWGVRVTVTGEYEIAPNPPTEPDWTKGSGTAWTEFELTNYTFADFTIANGEATGSKTFDTETDSDNTPTELYDLLPSTVTIALGDAFTPGVTATDWGGRNYENWAAKGYRRNVFVDINMPYYWDVTGFETLSGISKSYTYEDFWTSETIKETYNYEGSVNQTARLFWDVNNFYPYGINTSALGRLVSYYQPYTLEDPVSGRPNAFTFGYIDPPNYPNPTQGQEQLYITYNATNPTTGKKALRVQVRAISTQKGNLNVFDHYEDYTDTTPTSANQFVGTTLVFDNDLLGTEPLSASNDLGGPDGTLTFVPKVLADDDTYYDLAPIV